MDSEWLQFPIIIKPDQWRRWQWVRKIQSLQEATEYVVQLGQPCLLQEFSEYKEEFAVVYYRYPDAKMWYVWWVTQKSFFDIVGDWVKTVEELVAEHPRWPLYKNVLYEANTKNRQKVLGQWEVFRLMPVWSHSRWTIFEDISHKISPELDATIDSLAKQIPDAYFWRFDIKAENFEALEKWYVHIMEFNWTEAEPVHMYDPQNSLFDAYAIMFAHRYRMYTIAIKNNENWFAYASRKEIYANVRKIM